MNDKNLVPQSKRTKSEQRRIARQGGKASGEARRRKRTLRQCLLSMRDMEGADGLTQGEKWCLALAERAAAGDVAAFKLIHEIMAEREPSPLDFLFPDEAECR